MCLLLGKTRSQFESRNNQLDDSLLVEAEKLPFNQENLDLFAQQLSLLPHSHFRYTIYKITAPQHVYYYDIIVSQHYRYEEPTDAFAWIITPASGLLPALAAGNGRRGLPARCR